MIFKINAIAVGYTGYGHNREYLDGVPVVLTLSQKSNAQGYDTDDLELIDYDRLPTT